MSALASDPPFFKIGTTTACFMGAGNTVVASEALMIRASRGERALMCCLTIYVGSGSSSHDFVADASTIFFTSEGDACSNTSKCAPTTVGVLSAGSGDRFWHSTSVLSLKYRWNLVASAKGDSSATSGRVIFTFQPRRESVMP